jgi:hypothetical protein
MMIKRILFGLSLALLCSAQTSTTLAPVMVYPSIQFVPTALSFPATPVAVSSATQTVTATSYSNYNQTITVSLVGTNAGDFSETDDCPTGAGMFFAVTPCTITVTFTPTATGSRTARAQIAIASPSGFVYSAALTGTGM